MATESSGAFEGGVSKYHHAGRVYQLRGPHRADVPRHRLCCQDATGKEPGSAGYGERKFAIGREREAETQKQAEQKRKATEARQAKKKKKAGGGGGGGVTTVTQPQAENWSETQRVCNIKVIRACIYRVETDRSTDRTIKEHMSKLREQCIAMMWHLADNKATASLHHSYVSEFRKVARDKSCPNLEGFLASLVNPNDAQQKENRKFFGCGSMPRDRVESFRDFYCVGCGSFQHLFLNPNTGTPCGHGQWAAEQKRYWNIKKPTPTATVCISITEEVVSQLDARRGEICSGTALCAGLLKKVHTTMNFLHTLATRSECRRHNEHTRSTKWYRRYRWRGPSTPTYWPTTL
eukprot:COSAG06_NODE_663_length_13295_cov_33.836945_5_plen_349_part_00